MSLGGKQKGSFSAAQLRALADRAETRVEFERLVLVGGAVLPRIEERVRAAIRELYGWDWPHWETDYRAALFRVMQAPLDGRGRPRGEARGPA